jgi:hypothetical protein
MKFFCISRLLSHIECQDYELLEGSTIVTARPGRSVVMLKSTWGSGWIFDADEEIRSWCMILHGFDLVYITDQEFHQFQLDNRLYIDGKERASKVRTILKGQHDRD